MADQKDNEAQEQKKQLQLVTEAVRRLSETEDGVVFFRWLKEQCFFHRSTISGNHATYEVNTLGSISQEYQRALYLKLRRAFSRNAKIKIEVE